MVDPVISPTAVADPPVVTPPVVTPPAATPPPVVVPETPPAATPPVTPPPAVPPTAPKTDEKPPITEADQLVAPVGTLMTKEYVAQFQKDAIEAGLSKDEAQDLLNTQVRDVKEYDDRSKQSI